MDKKKTFRIVLYALLAVMVILTVLFFFDIKFVVGLNIIKWDIVLAVVWIFVKVCIWVNRKFDNGLFISIVSGIMAFALFVYFVILSFPFTVFLLFISGLMPHEYVEHTEPQTNRTFAVEFFAI